MQVRIVDEIERRDRRVTSRAARLAASASAKWPTNMREMLTRFGADVALGQALDAVAVARLFGRLTVILPHRLMLQLELGRLGFLNPDCRRLPLRLRVRSFLLSCAHSSLLLRKQKGHHPFPGDGPLVDVVSVYLAPSPARRQRNADV